MHFFSKRREFIKTGSTLAPAPLARPNQAPRPRTRATRSAPRRPAPGIHPGRPPWPHFQSEWESPPNPQLSGPSREGRQPHPSPHTTSASRCLLRHRRSRGPLILRQPCVQGPQRRRERVVDAHERVVVRRAPACAYRRGRAHHHRSGRGRVVAAAPPRWRSPSGRGGRAAATPCDQRSHRRPWASGDFVVLVLVVVD